MRFYNTILDGTLTPCVAFECGGKLFPLSLFGLDFECVEDVITSITDAQLEALKNAKIPGDGIDESGAELLSPIRRPAQDVICLGINYMEHARESFKYKKEEFNGERPYAVYFAKRVNEAVAPCGDIDAHADITKQLDYETELAVILRRDAKNVSAADAKNYVFGYTILNDVSARDIQNRHKQWYFGKSLDGCTPIGPCVVTADEFAFPPALGIRSYVNGELRQQSNTSQMIFDIPFVIEELSRGMTLRAGTIISTGTPSGVGMGMTPPTFLNIGDEVVCEIDEIGKICNIIK